MRKCRTRPPSPPVHLSPLPLVTAGVCFCLHCFLAASPHTRPNAPRSTPYAPTDLARAPPTRPTHHTSPCPACKTSSSTMRRRSAARCASRSSTCRTGTSGRVPAATKYAPLQRPVQPRRAVVLTTCQICQFCYNNIKTTMNGLCPACRRPYDDSTIEWKTISPEECVPYTSRRGSV
jgi:hypothetical protein